jgi:hypothetical protein
LQTRLGINNLDCATRIAISLALSMQVETSLHYCLAQITSISYVLLPKIQGVFEMGTEILITSYWLHVELGKNILKILSKNKMTFIF